MRTHCSAWACCRIRDVIDELEDDVDLSVRTHAAAFYVALLKARAIDEATEFAEWYLDTFDHDLET